MIWYDMGKSAFSCLPLHTDFSCWSKSHPDLTSEMKTLSLIYKYMTSLLRAKIPLFFWWSSCYRLHFLMLPSWCFFKGAVANSKSSVSPRKQFCHHSFLLTGNDRTFKLLVFMKVNVDQLKKRAERFGVNVSAVSQKVQLLVQPSLASLIQLPVNCLVSPSFPDWRGWKAQEAKGEIWSFDKRKFSHLCWCWGLFSPHRSQVQFTVCARFYIFKKILM